MIEFYKDNDALAVRTDVSTDVEFLDGCAKALSEMIEQKAQAGDWEFALGFWLPQIVDITCSLKGYKSDVVARTMRSAGSSHFISAAAVATLNDRKEVFLKGPGIMAVPAGEVAQVAAKAKTGK